MPRESYERVTRLSITASAGVLHENEAVLPHYNKDNVCERDGETIRLH